MSDAVLKFAAAAALFGFMAFVAPTGWIRALNALSIHDAACDEHDAVCQGAFRNITVRFN